MYIPNGSWLEIKQFWDRVNVLLRETAEHAPLPRHQHAELQVNDDEVLFSFMLPPPLQALQVEMNTLELDVRQLAVLEGNDHPGVCRLQFHIMVLYRLFKFFLAKEVDNFVQAIPSIQNKRFKGIVCDDWQVKYVELPEPRI